MEKLKHGETDGAMVDFTQALQFDPEDTFDAYTDRGNARNKKGDFAGAIADYTRALEFDPDLAADYDNRAVARSMLGDYEGAEVDYTHLIELSPDDHWYTFRRGIARQILGDFKGAVADYDRTVELNPNNSPISRVNRQLLRLRLGHAPADFAADLLTWQDTWMETVGRFVAGQADQKTLLAAAGTGDSGPEKARRAAAAYYIGMSQLLKGDRASAQASFQQVMADGEKTTDEYQLARAELARLQDPGQP
jgi:tetratricopeptide (TPR) repeat protein